MSFRKSLLTTGAVLSSLVAPSLVDAFSPARADKAPSNWYFTVGSGFVAIEDADITTKETGYTDVDGELKYDPGFAGNIGVGYDFGDFRLEATYGYSSLTTESVKLMEGGVTINSPLSTNLKNHSFNVGGFYDINTGDDSDISPYLGARAGFVSSTLRDIKAEVDVDGTGVSVSTDEDTDKAFTYELLGGLSLNVSERADVFIEAGWLGVADRSFDVGNNATIDVDAGGGWTSKIGFRYRM